MTRFERVGANQPDRNVRSFQRRYTAYRADKINNIDISMIKNIRIVERWTMQFRVEAFNAFNRTNFNGPELNRVELPSVDHPVDKTTGIRQ